MIAAPHATRGSPPGEPAGAAHRLVAVGASNLARLALPLLEAARSRHAGAVEAHFVLGRGRSFGLRSSLLGRGLAGIRDSELWRRLPDLPPLPTTALLMDVGNDLLYGVEVPRIVDWVEEVFGQLRAVAGECHVVGLPLASIRRLPAWRFQLVRTLLVPASRLTHARCLAASEQLQEALRRLATASAARFHEPPEHWYGLDPVHVRRRHWRAACSTWLQADGHARDPGTLAHLRFLFAAPAERTWFGRTTRTGQPVHRWPDGSSVSLW